MDIETARFVPASKVFDGFDALKAGFDNGERDFSFGDNDRTLIEKSRYLTAVEESNEDADEDQIKSFRARVEAIPTGVYIDLEN